MITPQSMEERFEEEFPPTFHRVDGKDFIEVSSYATTPERIKSFIRAEKELSKEDGKNAAIEIVKKSRTINEQTGIGAKEETARTQAIVDIVGAKSNY